MQHDIEARLDEIACAAHSAELKNAIHACRPSHPLNKTAVRPFLNAWWMAVPAHSGISMADCDWLESEARKRGKELGSKDQRP